ncbi:MAG TPA: hypothetical protein VFQ53_00850 [Kofleriaceae bacterium]|nr:hypothetical protein [Kofleriaceae bacterium]
MTTALVTRRDYLDGQRRRIIGRAIAGSMASALPIPFLDDWAVGAIVGTGYRRIAAAHQIDLDDEAVTALVHGTSKPTSIGSIAVAGVMARLVGRAAKRMMVVLATVNRARSASRTFVTMTLFDHYCAKLHTGLSLDRETALALRDEIGKAIDNTPGALSFHPFRRGASAAIRATLRAPLELADLASRGAVRRLLAPKSEITEAEAVDELDQTIEAELARKTGFLSRSVAAIEVQLSSEANPFLDAVIDNLDRRWRARMAVRPKP